MDAFVFSTHNRGYNECNASAIPLPSFNVDIWTTDAVRDKFFCYSATLRLREQQEHKCRFFGLTLDVV